MEKNEKIKYLLITAIITVITSMLTASITSRNAKVNNAAPIEYVDKQDKELYIYVDKQDGKIIDYTKKIDQRQQEDSKVYQKKFDNMYEMVLDIWKELKKN
jgi:hypothetical protein